MHKLIFGSHYSISNGIDHALLSSISDKCNIVQIFLSNPIARGINDLNPDYIKKINTIYKNHDILLVVHSPYIINLAKPFKEPNWQVKQLIKELTIGSKIKSIGSVIHFGKALDLPRKIAIHNMYLAISYILQHIPHNTKLILETSAGQGSELCYTIDEFASLWKLFSNPQKKQLGICIDTCHIFAAGYDIGSKEGSKKYKKEFDKKIGWENVCLIQLNDSMHPLGSKLDRHANLGKGHIGLSGLKQFIKYGYKYAIPLVLETPEIGSNYHNDLKIIKSTI